VSALVPGGRVYLDQVESVKEIKMTVEVGRRFPLHAGSSSTCILAFLPTAQQEEVLAGRLDALTPRTIVDPSRLRDRLDEVLRTGVAQSDGERQAGAGSVAAPVFGVDGSVQGAISVCGPADRVGPATRQRFMPLLVDAADRVSRGMGWHGGLPGHGGPR
jgi:IclR family transcriptional regulator, acetate operon repressor